MKSAKKIQILEFVITKRKRHQGDLWLLESHGGDSASCTKCYPTPSNGGIHMASHEQGGTDVTGLGRLYACFRCSSPTKNSFQGIEQILGVGVQMAGTSADGSRVDAGNVVPNNGDSYNRIRSLCWLLVTLSRPPNNPLFGLWAELPKVVRVAAVKVGASQVVFGMLLGVFGQVRKLGFSNFAENFDCLEEGIVRGCGDDPSLAAVVLRIRRLVRMDSRDLGCCIASNHGFLCVGWGDACSQLGCCFPSSLRVSSMCWEVWDCFWCYQMGCCVSSSLLVCCWKLWCSFSTFICVLGNFCFVFTWIESYWFAAYDDGLVKSIFCCEIPQKPGTVCHGSFELQLTTFPPSGVSRKFW